MLLRFIYLSRVSAATTETEYLGWLSEYLAAKGAKVLLLVWDNASWHLSKQVRSWIAGQDTIKGHGTSSPTLW